MTRNLEDTVDLKTACVQFVLGCNIAFVNCPKSLAESDRVIQQPQSGIAADGLRRAMSEILSRGTIERHAIILDDAVDVHTQDVIARARSDGSFVGFSFSPDESPSAASRYAGLRFQIAFVYVLLFKPVSSWDSSEWDHKPPLRRL